MKEWLRNKLQNFLNPPEELTVSERIGVMTRDTDIDERGTLRFTVTPARGGVIVNVRHYDSRADENYNTLHVIHDDENVSQRVSEIVSLSLLHH